MLVKANDKKRKGEFVDDNPSIEQWDKIKLCDTEEFPLAWLLSNKTEGDFVRTSYTWFKEDLKESVLYTNRPKSILESDGDVS